MIGQCLSNKNESATVSKSKNFLHLNKPLVHPECIKKPKIDRKLMALLSSISPSHSFLLLLAPLP